MRNTLVLLGITFLIILLGAMYAFTRSSPEIKVAVSGSNPSTTTDESMTSTLALISSAFDNGGEIPSQFTCDGEQVNPPLSVSGVPEGTKSLVLIMDDPDVPKKLRPDGVFDHWTLFNIPPEVREIPMGSSVGTLGANTAGKSEYIGPCPPREYEPSEHRYFFKLYALDTNLALSRGASKFDVLQAMEEHILARAELVGRYRRP